MKFAVLKFKHIFQFSPWRFWFFSNEVPGGSSEQSRERERRFPAMGLAGGEGKVGENGEGLESYLWVAVARRERDEGGWSAERGGRPRFWSPASMLR